LKSQTTSHAKTAWLKLNLKSDFS